MDHDPDVFLEGLGGFLQDLPEGGHALVRLPLGQRGRVLDVAARVAKDAGETLWSAGFGPGGTEQAVVAASPGWLKRTLGHEGPAMVAVDAGGALPAGIREHLAFEQAAREPGPRRRIVCFYTEETLAAFGGHAGEAVAVHEHRFPPAP